MATNLKSKEFFVFSIIMSLLPAALVALSTQALIQASRVVPSTGAMQPPTVQDYVYLVYQSGSTYYMKSGLSGQIVGSGSTAHVVVNWALGNLTSGRAWKEKVVLKGNFTLTGSIIPSSYTVLNLTDATLKTTSNTVKIIDFKGTSTTHKKYLDIIGGHFIGANTFGQGPEVHCALHTNYADYVTVTDGLYEGFYGPAPGSRGQAIWIGPGSNIKITATIPAGTWVNGNWIANPNPSLQFFNNQNSYQVIMVDTIDSVLENAYIKCGDRASGINGTGIYLGGSHTSGLPRGCVIRNNEIFDWYSTGKMSHAVYFGGSVAGPNNQIIGNYIHCEQQSGGTAVQVKCANTLIANNLISHNHDDYGIELYCEGEPTVSGTQIINNTLEDMYRGIAIGADYATSGNIEYVTVKDNIVTGYANEALDLYGWSSNLIRYCDFIGNKLSGTYGIRFEGGDSYSLYNRFIGNDLTGASTKISGRGTYSTFINNTGFNPVGTIANPVSGSMLLDAGTGTIANNALYTCWESPKQIVVSGGVVSSIQVDGVEMLPKTTVTVNPSHTIQITWSVAPTIEVVGQ